MMNLCQNHLCQNYVNFNFAKTCVNYQFFKNKYVKVNFQKIMLIPQKKILSQNQFFKTYVNRQFSKSLC
jgi:hypothetical protein